MVRFDLSMLVTLPSMNGINFYYLKFINWKAKGDFLVKKLLIILFFNLMACSNLLAADIYPFENLTQQQLFHSLLQELRCVVCQNQSLAESNAILARDLRDQIYERIKRGESKDEIISFMRDRYGDFVFYSPPFNSNTWFLWCAPLLFVFLGLFTLMRYSRR